MYMLYNLCNYFVRDTKFQSQLRSFFRMLNKFRLTGYMILTYMHTLYLKAVECYTVFFLSYNFSF